jgi:hypothetical protein
MLNRSGKKRKGDSVESTWPTLLEAVGSIPSMGEGERDEGQLSLVPVLMMMG